MNNEFNQNTDMNNESINDTLSNNNIQTETNAVEPIKEVEITTSTQNKKYELPKSEKNPKLTSFFLITFFILLFAYVMAMPYVDEWITTTKRNKEEQEMNKLLDEKENNIIENTKQVTDNKQTLAEYTTLTCTLNKAEADYTLLTTETFDYDKNNQIIKSTKTDKYTFTAKNDTYNTLTKKCNDSLNYISKEGYTISCNYTDTEIVIGNEFDLETFKTIQDANTTIEKNATYKENIETVKAKLAANGYICK